ncbi:hypothetical protein [Barrientosiimonas humi]|uniref:hypothetical protein n=1 Tax=Barrientosiimonas humi TaxID=999931 RepID=UPI00370D221A
MPPATGAVVVVEADTEDGPVNERPLGWPDGVVVDGAEALGPSGAALAALEPSTDRLAGGGLDAAVSLVEVQPDRASSATAAAATRAPVVDLSRTITLPPDRVAPRPVALSVGRGTDRRVVLEVPESAGTPWGGTPVTDGAQWAAQQA